MVQRLRFYDVRMREANNNNDCDPVIEMKNVNCVFFFSILALSVLFSVCILISQRDCRLLF